MHFKQEYAQKIFDKCEAELDPVSKITENTMCVRDKNTGEGFFITCSDGRNKDDIGLKAKYYGEYDSHTTSFEYRYQKGVITFECLSSSEDQFREEKAFIQINKKSDVNCSLIESYYRPYSTAKETLKGIKGAEKVLESIIRTERVLEPLFDEYIEGWPLYVGAGIADIKNSIMAERYKKKEEKEI